ncbi:hypothetical protein L6164_035375 [Bauhinia variegata]|uniref:Uncharacterized protein n=1 Tax=Bauhinia variegata TaxID=167791 RepID=A0ACB9KDS5_BAUVA|nr:hypothetical protein L6164_035375 [Bauhinia variegata]
MDSSGSGTVDCGVGSIVWVRRRNGSWWPGQILGPDELSASHLTSPRSGTPVKLLGREDASVDWYNLEKSKRVKAFRCGEFDDCIERAESSQGMPIKKREKYARREDAILHALELEREMLKKQGKLGIASDRTNCRSSSAVRKGIVTSSETMGNDNEKRQNSSSHTSYENELHGGPFPSNIANDSNQLSGEEDHSEATPRMRGLQDFGLKIAPLKGKLSSSVDPNIFQKLTVDDSAQALASGGLSLGSAVHTDGQIGVAYRSKRSRCLYLPAESSDSLDFKETPTNVEMSSSQFGGECPHPGSLAEESESAFMDDAESDSSETESTDSDSDSSETEPDMDEEMTILSEAGGDAEERGSATSEEPDELAISSDMPHLFRREGITSNEAVSKWQLKGKRNHRNLGKRPAGALDGKGNTYGVDNEGRSHLSHKRLGPSMHFYGNDFTDAFDDAEIYGLEDEYSLASRHVSKGQNRIRLGRFGDDWIWEDQPSLKGYWDVKGFTPVYDDRYHFSGRMRPMLVNVDLKVQAGYQKEPVPIVSLTSKIDGKAIIGHPIQIETLQDGSSDSLLSGVDVYCNDGIGIEGSSVLPPAWRTARRTANFRIPRPHVSSSNGAEAASEFSFLDQERKFEVKKLNAGTLSHKGSLSKKGVHRSTTDKKSSKRGPKKVTLSSSQKTRTLSSLSIEHSLSKKPLHDNSSYQTDRLIKPVASGQTTVACIPVKLVFSRLLEKINRPPLKAASTAALSNTAVERNL